MRSRSSKLLASGLLLAVATALADEPNGAAIRLGEPVTTQWRIGVVVKAPGAVTGILATTPVPMDWPEQSVRIVGEEKTPSVGRISYRTLDGGVKQMLVSIPRLAEGDEARAIVTIEVAKCRILEPMATTGLVVPAKTGRELSKFLLPSPYIESKHAQDPVAGN